MTGKEGLMADTYWREAREGELPDWSCCGTIAHLVRVPDGALLIEDAEGAVERMLDCLPRILAEAWNARWWAGELLRAAVGAGE